jgi:hypothetical protein
MSSIQRNRALEIGLFCLLRSTFHFSPNSHRRSRPARQFDRRSHAGIYKGIIDLSSTATRKSVKICNGYLDALAGARIFNVSSTTNFSVNGFQVGYTQNSNTTSVDTIVGLKGRVRIAESDYFIPFYADVGGGGGTTQLTSQAFLGAGRAFGWGDVQLGVKNLYYSQKNQNVTTNLNFMGVAAGVTFRF